MVTQTQSDAALLNRLEKRILLEEIGSLSLCLQHFDSRGVGIRVHGPGSVTTSPIERAAQISKIFPKFLERVQACLRRQDMGLKRVRRYVAAGRCHADQDTLRWIATTGSGASFWRGSSSETATQKHLPMQALIPTSETFANQWLADVVGLAHRELTALYTLAVYCEEEAVASHLNLLLNRLTPVLQRLPLCPQDRPNGTLQGRDALLRAAPPYLLLWRAWEEWNGTLYFDWSDCPVMEAGLVPDWKLYEIWCLFMIATSLKEVGYQPLPNESIRVSQRGMRLRLVTGKESKIRFTSSDGERQLSLYYQPYFRGADQIASQSQTTRGFTSSTHTMQPDFLICVDLTFHVLDAKFRAYRQEAPQVHAASGLLNDLDKMHTYRDALRWNGNHSAVSAWCLFPGDTLPDAPNCIAFPTANTSQPFGKAGIGALRLRPGTSHTHFIDWCAAITAHQSSKE